MSSACTFGSGRDIAYLVFSILQFAMTAFGLWWVHKVIKNRDDKKEQERLKKKERKEIVDITDAESKKIVKSGIDEKLKKCKERFEAMVMFYGIVSETDEQKYKITGLDVLRFMLLKGPNDFKNEPLTKLQEDLDTVENVFQTLHIKLPHPTSTNIQKLLGSRLKPLICLITQIAKIARSFVRPAKRSNNEDAISKVLKYFDNGHEDVRSEEKDDEFKSKILRVLPYVKILSFGETWPADVTPVTYYDQDFNTKILLLNLDKKQTDTIFELLSILSELYKRFIETVYLTRFAETISEIWSRNFRESSRYMPDWNEKEHLNANIIHAVRVFLFKVAEGNDIIHDENFRKLVDEMKKITYAQFSEEQNDISFRAMGKIHDSIQHLGLSRQMLHPICGQKSFANMLNEVSKIIEDIIRKAESECR